MAYASFPRLRRFSWCMFLPSINAFVTAMISVSKRWGRGHALIEELGMGGSRGGGRGRRERIVVGEEEDSTVESMMTSGTEDTVERESINRGEVI